MSALAASEAAAAQEPGGPRGPTEMWLLTQRLDDIRRGQDELRAEMKEQIADLRRSQDELRVEVKEQIADLRRSQDEVRAEVKEQITDLRTEMGAMHAKIDGARKDLSAEIASLRNWSLGLLLLAILGLLAKLLIPGV